MSRSRQYTRKELETLRRADLQTLYKIHGLRGANQRTDALINALDTFYHTAFVPPVSPGRRPGTTARQLKPIPDQTSGSGNATALPPVTGKPAGGGVRRRPLPIPHASGGVKSVKSSDNLSEGSRLQTATSTTSGLQEKLSALSERVATLDSRLSEPSSSGLASDVARLRAEVERLEGELNAVKDAQTGQADSAASSSEAAVAAAVSQALMERDEAWAGRMRAAEVEWKAQLGALEARWEGRFARLEEMQRNLMIHPIGRIASTTLGKRPHDSTSTASATSPSRIPTARAEFPVGTDVDSASASKRPRTISGPSITDHSAIREQVKAAARRSLSPSKSPRTPSPSKADRGEATIFKTPELPASAVRGALKRVPDIGLGMATGPGLFGMTRRPDETAYDGAAQTSTEAPIPDASAASEPASTSDILTTPTNPISALGLASTADPRTPSPTPARRAFIPDNAATPSAFGPDYFAGLPLGPVRSGDRQPLPFPLFATTPKPTTTAPRSPTLDAPPSASSKRRQAALDAEEVQATGHMLGLGTPRTPYSRTPGQKGRANMGGPMTPYQQSRRVSEKVAMAHVGLMGVTESAGAPVHAALASGSAHGRRLSNGATTTLGSNLGGVINEASAQMQDLRRARSVSSQRSLSRHSHDGSGDGDPFPDVIQEEDEDEDVTEAHGAGLMSAEGDDDEGMEVDIDTPRPRLNQALHPGAHAGPSSSACAGPSLATGMKRVISKDFALRPHLRLGEVDADGEGSGSGAQGAGVPALSPSPSITENRFSSLPFPRPGPSGSGTTGAGASLGGHTKHRSISNTSHTSDRSTHSALSDAIRSTERGERTERSEHPEHSSTHGSAGAGAGTEAERGTSRSRSRSVRSSSPSRDFMDIALHGYTDESPSARPPHTPAHRTLLGTERYRDNKYGDLPFFSLATPGEGEMDFGETPRRG